MSTEIKQQATYSIPLVYRRMENLHIVFWLFKDVAWCLQFKLLGIIMVIPTLTIAIVIAYRTRKIISELCHNIAIAFWITANSYWMIAEFYHFDENIAVPHFTYKNLTLIPFVCGILVLEFYYVYWKQTNKNEVESF